MKLKWCEVRVLGSVRYIFIFITYRFTLTGVAIPISVPSMGQIDMFRNYSYSKELCKKTQETTTQKIYVE